VQRRGERARAGRVRPGRVGPEPRRAAWWAGRRRWMATYRGGSSMNQRNDLFGARAAAPASGGGLSYAEQTRQLYEEENNRQTAVLGEQVGRLKELSLLINTEVNQQNDLLDGMGSSFGQTGQLMAGTLKKLQHMIDTGGSKHMCYLVLFIVCLFLFMYMFLIRN
jgi:blocked-early-in-transport protein 1